MLQIRPNLFYRFVKRLSAGTLVALLWLLSPSLTQAALAATIYVDADALGANNGSSWNDAFTKLQDALAIATSGDEIWVAEGVYYPDEGGGMTDNDRTSTFQLKNGVYLYGGFSGSESGNHQRDFFANLTILSGDIDQNDTNTDGNNVAETWNDLQGNNAYHVVTGSGTDLSAVLNGFTITAGQTVADAPSNSCFDQLCGGGVFIESGSPNLAFLTISGNQAKHGGGILVTQNSNPFLLNVTFRGNRATGFGGGMSMGFSSNPTFINVAFSGNRADVSNGGLSIGSNSNPTLVNATFSGNQGEGIGHFSSNSTLINVIVWGNDTGGEPQIYHNASTATIRNSLIQGSGGSGAGWDTSLGTDGGGNLDADPLFVDANGADNLFGTPDDNLRLLAGSPAIDRGDNSANDRTGDLDLHDRVQNGTIDLGGYEGGRCPTGPVLYVNRAATGVTNGQIWAEALTSLQDALAVSAACASVTEIWVAAGVYYPDVGGGKINNDRSASFQLKSGLAVYGGFAGTEATRDQRDPAANLTILSGDIDQNDTNIDGNNVAETWNDIQGNNAYNVVRGGGADSTSVLDGFTITAGKAEGPSTAGGGMFNDVGSPQLSNLAFVGNQAGNGGGIYNQFGSSPALSNVLFSGNRATGDGGAIYNLSNSTPSFTNVTFRSNRAEISGGGLYNNANGSPTLTNVTFAGNQAGVHAGGMKNTLSSPVLTNVTFSGNTATNAGAIVQFDGTLRLNNVTITGNQAGTDGAVHNSSGAIEITNSILANSVGGANCGGAITSGDYNLSSDASCNFTQAHDKTNVDPKLDALADNNGATQTHGLQIGSPAVDAGNCSGGAVTQDQRGVNRPQGAACDIGALESTSVATYDFGDARDPSYPTLLANNGARHGQVSNRRLGATVDSEADGQPNADATGDDANGDDEDGVAWPTVLNACQTVDITVTPSAAGLLNGWIDFNADGDWSDAGEQIFRGLALNAGAQTLRFQTPCEAVLGVQTAARFRFSGTSIVGFNGAVFDGEVEDYSVSFQRGSPIAQADNAMTSEDKSILIHVLANDSDPVGGPLVIASVAQPARGTAVVESGLIRYTPNVDFFGADSFRYTLQNEVGKQTQAQVNVLVRAANDPPTNLTLSNNSITARSGSAYYSSGPVTVAPGTEIGVLNTSDPDRGDTHTYKLASTSQGSFEIVNGSLRTLNPLDLNRSSFAQYTVVILSTDQVGASIERNFTVTIFGPTAPDGPIGVTLNNDQVGENQPANTVVGLLNTADAGGGSHTYTLVPGRASDDNASFSINGNQLRTTRGLDYEAKELYSIRVRTVNSKGAGMEQPLVIKVVDDNSEPGEPAPQNCSGAEIKLVDTADATLAVSNVTIVGATANGCTVQGRLRVRIPGSEASDIAFTGRVDAKNQLHAEVGAFQFGAAGLTFKVKKGQLFHYLGRPGLRLTDFTWCAPAEWGGMCVWPRNNSILIDGSGLKAEGELQLPDLLLGKAGNKIPVPKIFVLKGKLYSVSGGYEISAAGEFSMPKMPIGGSVKDCGLKASIILYVDAVTGATVMELNAAATGPQTLMSTDSVALRQVSISLKCDEGIKMGPLQLTAVRGTLTLRPGNQSIKLGVTVETIAKKGPITLAKADGDATVLWDPEWGFDLLATVKLLGFMEMARADTRIRDDHFYFHGQINAAITYGVFTVNAWTDSGANFSMTGAGSLNLGIGKGALMSGSSTLVTAAHTDATAASLGLCFGLCTKAVEVAKDVGSELIDKGKAAYHKAKEIFTLTLPPYNIHLASVNADFGRFTNNDWGFKGYIELSNVVGNTAQKVLDFFHVPSQFGFFINSSGDLEFGGVTKYVLVTPPPPPPPGVQAAATDQQFSFVSQNEVIIATPLRLDEPVVRAATVISQVRISAPAEVNFVVASFTPLTMSLIAPNGTHITPANHNQPPINQQYRVDYEQSTLYEPIGVADAADPSSALLRFVPASSHASLAAVDVLVDGVPVWKNVKPFNPTAPDPNYDSQYIAIDPGVHTLSLVPTGQNTVIVSTTLNAATGVGYTLATAGVDAPQLRLLSDEEATPPSFGQAYARFVYLGDADRRVNVRVNGSVLYSDLSYPNASAYQLLPTGDVTIEIVDAVTGAILTPERLLLLGDTSLVFTFFLFDRNIDTYTLNFTGVIDEFYIPRIYTIYNVGGADMGDWKVDLVGDLSQNDYSLGVFAYAEPTQLGEVTVNANNLSQTQVQWKVKSEFAPTVISLYANPGALTSPFSYTNTSGISVTEEITNFMGFLVTQVTVSDPAQLNNALGSLTADLSKLESGTYRLWLQADDGVNPARAVYARDAGTKQIAVITVDNAATFPQTWTPTITPTLDLANALLAVEWGGLTHPDIDSYTLHLGATPGASERTESGLVPDYPTNDEGKPIGPPTVFGAFSNIEAGQIYHLFIEAIDEGSGRLVRSQPFSLTLSSGDYALTTLSDRYQVARGSTIIVPLSLAVTAPLFDPNVALAIDGEGLPRGIWVQFENDLLGETVLRDASGAAHVSAAGANNIVILDQAETLAGDPAAQPSVNLVITVTNTVSDGIYPLTLVGYNGRGMERSHTMQLQVGAVALQAQTMCYGENLDVSIVVGPAAMQAGFDLVVISGPLPPNLLVSGAVACVPYTGLRSLIELTNQLVTQGCANGMACHSIKRIVFDYDSSYRIETIQEVQTPTELYLPLVHARCSDGAPVCE